MSLQTRLEALVLAVGTDIKDLRSRVDAKSAKGDKGDPGSQWYPYSAGPPGDEFGVDGDLAFDGDTGDVWQKHDRWGWVGNFKGPKGDPGSDGAVLPTYYDAVEAWETTNAQSAAQSSLASPRIVIPAGHAGNYLVTFGFWGGMNSGTGTPRGDLWKTPASGGAGAIAAPTASLEVVRHANVNPNQGGNTSRVINLALAQGDALTLKLWVLAPSAPGISGFMGRFIEARQIS